MKETTVLETLASSQLSQLIRSELWGWPLALTLHALGTATVVGFIFVITLRLFGLFELIPYSALRRFFPVVWAGLILQVASGLVLWLTKPVQYTADGAFLLKLALIVVGIVMTANLSKMVAREAAGDAPPRATGYVAATLIVWCAVVVTGRLTGYLGAI